MYTISGCVHCLRARRLLRGLGIAFEERALDDVLELRALLLERTGGWTVPQIVIGDEPIGGARELARLQCRGILAARVGGEPFPVCVVRRRLSVRGMLVAVATRRGGELRRAAWRDLVELRDRDGRTVERAAVPESSAPVPRSEQKTTQTPTKDSSHA